MFCQVVFPLPFKNAFTYSIPDELKDALEVGVRVVVPFGKRILTGFVVEISKTTDVKEKIKPVRDVLDENPIFDKDSLKFYEWISEYYLSSLGEALRNSVPYGTDIESKRKIVSDKEYCGKLLSQETKKTSLRFKLLTALSQKDVFTISQLQKDVKNKNIYSSLRSFEKIGAVSLLDEISTAKVRVKKIKHVEIAKPADEIYELMPEIEKKSSKQVVLLLELLSNKEPIALSELLKKTNTASSVAGSLEKKNIVRIFDKEVERSYSETYKEKEKEFDLTLPQKKIIERIGEATDKKIFETFLLHGVTGSGKTQVYIELAKKVIAEGKSIIILVPEISLTPQITSRFFNHFENLTAVLHSRMSLGERYDSWRGIIAGKSRVVIGPRSALFAPLKNIGLIVVDEEHDSSYKQQDIAPKYHARDAAIILARFNKCPVVLGSATPSVDSMYNALSGKYNLLELTERVDNAKLPVIKLVDVTIEKKKKQMESIFSRDLLDEIGKRLKKKENVIILQNRRGFATQIFCNDCGEVVTCPDCSVSMVHHLNKNILRCHYCGIVKPVPKACPLCGSLGLKFFGTGTQRVEDELDFYFPDVKIERVDSDAINKKGKLGEILNSFGKGEIDILVGTQMVSKGLDFANVTLVGVVAAETSLWIPDFRADERTFQLLTQVSGRSGRSEKEGEVIIQTQNQKHFVLQKVLMNDYKGFYENEIALREQFEYPPFIRIALIEIKDEREDRTKAAAKDFFEYLSKFGKGLKISPPTEAVIYKIKGSFRFQILIKSHKKYDPSGKSIRTAILNSLIEFNQKSRYRDVKLIIDVDPQSII
ncbi:MAG: primosomal protein N' [Ignavibacteriae bacterium HGW-Ignavibacteriae-3]|nr:MAG: primosomal protein N' [Ignavibacteriae bacterium HGW-Ignavibacteriae-3]